MLIGFPQVEYECQIGQVYKNEKGETIYYKDIIANRIRAMEEMYKEAEDQYMGAEGLTGKDAAIWKAQQKYRTAQNRIKEIKDSGL